MRFSRERGRGLARRYRRDFSAWMACSVYGVGKSCTSPKRSQPWGLKFFSSSRIGLTKQNSSPRKNAAGSSPRSPAERRATKAVRKFTRWQALYNPKVLLLALNFLGIVTASLGMQTGDGNIVQRL